MRASESPGCGIRRASSVVHQATYPRQYYTDQLTLSPPSIPIPHSNDYPSRTELSPNHSVIQGKPTLMDVKNITWSNNECTSNRRKVQLELQHSELRLMPYTAAC